MAGFGHHFVNSTDMIALRLPLDCLEDARSAAHGWSMCLMIAISYLVQRDRQISHALTGGVKDGIGNRCRNPDDARFA